MAALTPLAAFAADVPGNRSTTAVIQVGAGNSVNFETPNDSDWFKVQLEAGEEYVVTASDPGDYRTIGMKVADQSGNVVSKYMFEASYDYSGQSSVRAIYTGWYYVRLEDHSNRMPQNEVRYYYPTSEYFAIGPDCGQDAGTTCKLKLGVSQRRALPTPFDEDWFKVQLAAGRSYDVGGNICEDCYVSVVDAKGKILSGGDSPYYGTRGGLTGFKPTASGTYFVRVAVDAAEGRTYDIVLTQQSTKASR